MLHVLCVVTSVGTVYSGFWARCGFGWFVFVYGVILDLYFLMFYPICSSFVLRWDEQRILASAMGWAEKLYWYFGEKPNSSKQCFEVL